MLWAAVRRRWRRRGMYYFPTGSPFGHHPRLSMVCPRWGQWMSTLCRWGEWMQ